MKKLLYSSTQIILLTFSIDNKQSFENIEKKWKLEIMKYCPKIPIILIATKIDLRKTNPNEKYISKVQGQQLSDKIGALEYIECSSLTNHNVKDIFEESIRTILYKDGTHPDFPNQKINKNDDIIFTFEN